MRREKSSSSSSSSLSRKSKKSSVDKPKMPRRGLGVAQLEQIRLRSEMEMSCSFPSSSLMHGPANNNYTLLQEEKRVQREIDDNTLPQSSTSSYPTSQSLSSTSCPLDHHHNFLMFRDERANSKYQDFQPNSATRWNPNIHSSTYEQEGMHLFNHLEDTRQRRNSSKSTGSENLRSSEKNEEVDLELKLSI